MITALIIMSVLGLVGGLISAGVSANNNAQNVKAQKEANEANIKMNQENNQKSQELQELAYQQNIEQWNRENEYNLPANQMERFKAAGLNPNLVYHQQNTAGASPTMSYNAPVAGRVNPVMSPGIDLSGLMSAITQLPKLYMDAKMMPYQLEIAKNQAEQSTISTKYLAEQIQTDLAFKRLSQDELLEKIASLKLGNQSYPERFHNEMAKIRAEITNTLWRNKLLVGEITGRDLSNESLRIQNKRAGLELGNYQRLFDTQLSGLNIDNLTKQLNYEMLKDTKGSSRVKGMLWNEIGSFYDNPYKFLNRYKNKRKQQWHFWSPFSDGGAGGIW